PRMPVIVAGAALDTWLDPASEPARVSAALAGVPAAALRYVPVAKRVNSARLDEPDLTAPTGPETAGA
ncbi:MAG: SOS response-associated peptidase family protein, partial [Stellaceae bacterium]